jgi:hypothetical protein
MGSALFMHREQNKCVFPGLIVGRLRVADAGDTGIRRDR